MALNMNKILLINNPHHFGIRAVGEAYKRAFEYLGVDFDYVDFSSSFPMHISQVNSNILAKIIELNPYKVIFIQPSYLMANTYLALAEFKKNGISKFYSINTEDPYSTSAILMIEDIFNIIFTNEFKVAEKFKNRRFKYLPVAFDSLAPFKRSNTRDINLAFITTFYPDRYKYLKAIKDIELVAIGGSVAPLLITSSVMDYGVFRSRVPSVLRRYKELETYSYCKFAFNLHRNIKWLGKSFFNLGEGVYCPQIIDSAISPNPRFFDAIGCGSVSLNDITRTECFSLLRKYGISDETLDFFKLPDIDNFSEKLRKQINDYDKIKDRVEILSKDIKENETYITRAKDILSKIE